MLTLLFLFAQGHVAAVLKSWAALLIHLSLNEGPASLLLILSSAELVRLYPLMPLISTFHCPSRNNIGVSLGFLVLQVARRYARADFDALHE